MFSLFLVVRFPEKIIRKCFGGKEKEKRAKKKVIFKKKVLSSFFSAFWIGKTECVWEGICVRRITAGKR